MIWSSRLDNSSLLLRFTMFSSLFELLQIELYWLMCLAVFWLIHRADEDKREVLLISRSLRFWNFRSFNRQNRSWIAFINRCSWSFEFFIHLSFHQWNCFLRLDIIFLFWLVFLFLIILISSLDLMILISSLNLSDRLVFFRSRILKRRSF